MSAINLSDNEINSDNLDVGIIFTKQDLEDIIRNTISCQLFTIDDVSVRPASAKKLGFMGDHLKLAIDVTSKDNTATYHYFVKCMPIDNEQKKQFLLEFDGFSKEIIMYKIFNVLSTYLGKKPWYPLYYFSNDMAIVFEDLSLKGYQSLAPQDTFTKEHCLVALSGLAKLHASCLSFEEKRTKELGVQFRLEKEYKNNLDVSFFKMSGYYLVTMEAALAIIEKFSKYGQDSATFDIIKSKWFSLWEKNLELAEPSRVFRNVFVQRDMWGGNLMYRYENGSPKDCYIIDYQTIGMQPPAADVMDLLHMNTTKTLRTTLLEESFNHYYTELEKNLLHDGIIVQNILTKDEFLLSCRTYNLWALMHSCAESHMIYLSRDKLDILLDDAEQYGSTYSTAEGMKKTVFGPLQEDKKYRDFVLETLDELIEEYLLA